MQCIKCTQISDWHKFNENCMCFLFVVILKEDNYSFEIFNFKLILFRREKVYSHTKLIPIFKSKYIVWFSFWFCISLIPILYMKQIKRDIAFSFIQIETKRKKLTNWRWPLQTENIPEDRSKQNALHTHCYCTLYSVNLLLVSCFTRVWDKRCHFWHFNVVFEQF